MEVWVTRDDGRRKSPSDVMTNAPGDFNILGIAPLADHPCTRLIVLCRGTYERSKSGGHFRFLVKLNVFSRCQF